MTKRRISFHSSDIEGKAALLVIEDHGSHLSSVKLLPEEIEQLFKTVSNAGKAGLT